MPKYDISFEVATRVTARSRDEAIKKARAEIAKHPLMLTVIYMKKQ